MNTIASVMWSRLHFTSEMVFAMESSHPEAVEDMSKFSSKMFPIDAAGKVTSNILKGNVVWEPLPIAGLTRMCSDHGISAAPSAVSCSIASADMLTLASKACA
eukprot:SAG31_NODE_3348_length_4376_cov_2.145429_2_plen_103_part_00